MKVLVVLSAIVAVGFAKPSGLIAPIAYGAAPVAFAPPVEVSSQYHAQDELGQYSYGYSSPLSSKAEVRTVDGITRGGYSYVDAEGKLQSVQYAADPVNGFRVAASNLPISPIIPAVPSLVGPAPVQDTPEVVEAKARHLAAFKQAEAAAAAAPAEEAEVINNPEPTPESTPATETEPAPAPAPAPGPSGETAAPPPASTLPAGPVAPIIPAQIAPLPAPITPIGAPAAPLAYSYAYTAPAPAALTYSTYTTHVATAPIISYAAPAAYATYAAPITYTTHWIGAPIGTPIGAPFGTPVGSQAVEAKVAKVEEVQEKKV